MTPINPHPHANATATAAGNTALLVPIALEALIVRSDAPGLTANPLFTDPGSGPTTFTGSGESTGSAAAEWNAINSDPAATTTTQLMAADLANPNRLQVTTNLPGSGVIQHLSAGALGRRASIMTAQLYVSRGDIVVAVAGSQAPGLHLEGGPSGQIVGDGGRWLTIRTLYDAGVPDAIAVVAAPEAADGADFWVAEMSARAFDDGNLVENAEFDAAGPTTIDGADVESASSAAGWTIRHVGAGPNDATTTDVIDDPQPPAGQTRQVLRCQTTGSGCGLRQRLLSGGVSPAGAQASIRVYLESGTITLSCGLDRNPGVTATAAAAPAWQTLTIPQAAIPASIDVWATSPGTTFLVDQAWVQPNALDQLLSNPGFDDPADSTPAGQAVTVGPGTDGHNWAGGPSAASSWGVWNNYGDAVTTTELVPTTRPDGVGTMIHVTATRGGCGLAQVFLPFSASGGPRQVDAAVWVYVNSGSVVIGTGNGGDTSQDAQSATTGQWELVAAANGVWPATEFIIYAGEDGSDFSVDLAQVAEIGTWSPVAETELADPTTAATSGSFELRPAPFANQATGRPVGAHLMWALPDALAQADEHPAGSTEPITFPPIPDRWLVCRLAGTDLAITEPASRAVTAWLLSTDANGTAVVTPVDVTSTGASGGGPQVPTSKPPTALGPGDVTWSATYDNVENRLALYDPLTGAQGPLAYLVVGWHSDPADDPIGRGLTLEDLHWAVAGDASPAVDRTVYHGCAVSIGWPDQGFSGDANGALSEPIDNRPNPTALQAMLAGTLVDALTTLISSPSETKAQTTALTAFLQGAAGTYETPDGDAAIAAALHANGFASATSPPGEETIWQGSGDDASTDGQFQGVARSTPRLFAPGDPVVLIQGAGRSFTYGGDGRYDDTEGDLACRTTGQTITTLGAGADGPTAPAQVLSGLPSEPTLPTEAQALLVELAALDPGSAPGDTAASPSPAQTRTAWWLSWDPTQPAVVLAPDGALPSPIAVTPPTRSWTPVNLDWAVDFIPADANLSDWLIDGAELTVPASGLALNPAATATLEGSTALGASPASLLATGAATAVPTLAAHDAQDPTEVEAALESTLAKADIIGGSLTHFSARLRGDDVTPVVQLPGQPVPPVTPTAPDLTVRSGQLILARVRVVDAYGQVVDLPARALSGSTPSSDQTDGDDPPLGQTAAGLTLSPRLTSPAQVVFRYVDADGSGAVADDSVSPVCGYLMTDFETQAIDLFGADGSALGRLQTPPSATTAWQPPPGTTAPVGSAPSAAIPDPSLAGIAEKLLDHDVLLAGAGGAPTALGAMLTAIDTARFTIGLLPVGDEHLALLLGHPAVVYRASLTLSVDEATPPDDLLTMAIEVQLGALDRLQDGLLGYYVDGDFSSLRVPPGLTELASELGTETTNGALTPTYIDTDPLYIRPGQTLDLILLVEPSADVHITAGLLPQKTIGQRRSWIDQAMHHLTPSLAVGPVLMDPTQAALPLPTDIHGTWSWVHRPDPLSWQTDAIAAATDTGLGLAPLVARAGWLQIELSPEESWDDFGTPVQISYLDMTDRDDPDAVPSTIGAQNADGSGPWTQTIAEAAALIQSGRFKYFVQPTTDGNPKGPKPNPPTQFEIVVATNSFDQPTLTTASVEDTTNHLLELPELLLYDKPGSPNQTWDPIWDPTTVAEDCPLRWSHYGLTSRNSGRALDVMGGPAGVYPGTPLQQWGAIEGEANQQFQFIWIERSYFQIIAWNSGTCLEVAAASDDDGALVQLGSYTGATNQQWQPVSRDGYIVFLARHSGKAMTIVGTSVIADTQDGARCVQATYDGLHTQQWTPAAGITDPTRLDAAPLGVVMPDPPYYSQQGYEIEVGFRNTGNAAWTSPNQFFAPSGDLYGCRGFSPTNSLSLPTSSVLPGQSFNYKFLIQMPHAGVCSGGFQMWTPVVPPSQWQETTFGTDLTITPFSILQTTATVFSASLTIPTIAPLSAGESRTINVVVQNSGSVTLYSELATLEDLTVDGYEWNATRQAVSADAARIAPGASAIWPVAITAGASGAHVLKLMLIQSDVGNFGQSAEQTITVS
jgi:hypothetical protein